MKADTKETLRAPRTRGIIWKVEEIKCNKCKFLMKTKEVLEGNVAIPSFYCKKLKCQLLNGYAMLHRSKTCGE